MSFDFFRKEVTHLFDSRFSLPALPAQAYGLKSHVIFRAKNALGAKNFQVTVGDQKIDLVATVSGSELLVKNKLAAAKPKIMLRLSEDNIADALTAKVDSAIYAVAKKLCQDHTVSSKSSPLISGCTVNNFDASSAYDGYKLHLKLRFRQPFMNPFVSGLEKECFLIGQVLDTDCELIKFLGRTNEDRNELVNPFGSRIPRPTK
jgi:hypothetical protein